MNKTSTFEVEEGTSKNNENPPSPTLTKCLVFTSAALWIIGLLAGLITRFSAHSNHSRFRYSMLFKGNKYYNVTQCANPDIAAYSMQNDTIVYNKNHSKHSWHLMWECQKNFSTFIYEEYWKPKRHATLGMVFSTLFHSFAAICMLPAIYWIVRLYRKNKFASLSDLTLSLFHIAVILMVVELTIHMGQSTFMSWFSVVELYGLKFQGMSSLNTLFLISNSLDGTFLWLFTITDLLFSAGITALSYMTLSGDEHVLSKNHAYLGFAIGAIGVLSFLSSLLRFTSWVTFDVVNHILTFVSFALLLPIWLIWIGCNLNWVPREQFQSLLRS